MTRRPSWVAPPDSALRNSILANDAVTLDERLSRYRTIMEEFGPPAHMLLVGGVPAMFALHEMQRCFIQGNYLATVLMAQAFVEHSLGGSLMMAGDDQTAQSGFARLIDGALASGSIHMPLAQQLHNLRLMRNPYSHPRAMDHPQSYYKRLVDERGSPEDLVEADALTAVRTVVDYLRHGSPNWIPNGK